LAGSFDRPRMITASIAPENLRPGFAALRLMGGWERSCENISRGVFAENGDERTIPRRLDHEHYVQKQVRPVAEPVLALLGLDFDQVIGDQRQLSLF